MPDIKGEMGWHIHPAQAGEPTVAAELRALDDLQEQYPKLMQSTVAKAVVQETMTALKDLMSLDGIEDGIDLTYLEKLTFGQFLKWVAQKIGSCVASGGMRAIALTTLAQIMLHGQLEAVLGPDIKGAENFATFAPFSYLSGRQEGGLTGGDGSFCGAHIKGLKRYGALPCNTPGLDRLTDDYPEPQDMRTYRRWGDDASLLTKFDDVSRDWQLLESVRLLSADDWKRACIEKLHAAMICSMWAFELDYYHSTWRIDGKPVPIYRRNTRDEWAHNMTLVGCFYAANRWWVKVRNSWGPNAHSGNDWFIIPLSLLDDWLRHKWTVSMTIGNLELTKTSTIEA